MADVGSKAFAITDDHYGSTFPIWRCESCGYLQCPVEDPLRFYQALKDSEYEAGRMERSRQARKILKRARRYAKGRSLLDIGAATGMLVQEALALGWQAMGIEPSASFCEIARKHGLPVVEGTFPHPDARGPYDVVALIDVIEHVIDPVGLLRQIRGAMAPEGILLIATPDVDSVAARLMGPKWWHFRLAHIGYFSRKTIRTALDAAGLELVASSRPVWYFNLGYLGQRFLRYLPSRLRGEVPAWLRSLVIPLNLFDSLLLVCRKKNP
jgi:SAM-dependent methyltransferase